MCRTKIAGAAVLGGRTNLGGRRAAKRGRVKRASLLASEPVTQRFSPSRRPTLHYSHVRTKGTGRPLTDFLRLTAKSIPPPPLSGHGEVLYLNTAAFFQGAHASTLPHWRDFLLPFPPHVPALVTRLFSFRSFLSSLSLCLSFLLLFSSLLHFDDEGMCR